MSGSVVFGLLLMVISESATLAQIEPFWSWNTPIAWTGFIIFADGLVWQARGNSWIRSNPREFALLGAASIPLWLVFEFYNRFLGNWYYTGLSESRFLRYFGYAWSFSTIWPAIFEGAELVDVWREKSGRKPPARTGDRARDRRSGPGAKAFMLAGVLMLILPFIVPSNVARYLAAPVWLGFIFLLDPINFRLGRESIARDWERGSYDRLTNLAISGMLCGALWEFWNYWASAKWHYTVPIMAGTKIFEMPLPGYLGFPAFAVECFTMYVFVRAVTGRTGRAIAMRER